MDSKLNIESVTNGLLTFQRLKQLYQPAREGSEEKLPERITPDKLSLLMDTLTAVSDLIPVTRGPSFGEAFRLGSHYSGQYREMKRHVAGMSGGNIDRTNILKGLKLITPMLGNKQKSYMNKIVKIFDILES